ncbi:hypothetical protein C8J55DRAFT_522507 [Lentinula edodes]|uniref:BHLH domain-containing protein n=1 Tax=Lentinula lateritia TaxID=40482 RepID=A0A9W9DHG6_9AGAR|nr:hypothetical protein C8J55DRAFT_522507 [Lentinula edodes]
MSAGVDGAASSSTPGTSGNFPASTSAAAGGAAKPATKGAGRGAKNDKNDPGSGTGTRKSGRRGGGGAATGDSTGLKHILPATNPSPPSSSLRPSSNLNSTSAAATSSTTTIVPVKERKTSHKAAEQKRRDSLKTTFDDLRGLLPPIPLPTDGDSKSGGAAAVDDEIGFIALAKASLLPGALPPRGPPKVGEGPNKGVSKLQLLICGNEYIRVLKGRVERRDEEVERLRREVRRLRSKLIGGEVEEDSGSSGENENEGQEGYCYKDGEMLDLDRDLDAVEVLESMGTSCSGLSTSMNGGSYLTGVDEDVEED